MGTKVWQGGAPAVAQVQDYLFAGTWEADDVVTCTIGDVSFSIAAGSTTEATIVDNVLAAWNALSATTYPAFAEITASRSGDNLRLTADTAGKPFVCTVSTTEAGGGAADDQTIDAAATSTGTATTANAGPYCWDTAANWDAGVVPVDTDDVIFENSSVSCLYGLSQADTELTSLTIKKSYTGYIGLPRHTGTYPEYRTQYLTVDSTTVNVGQGEGSGSGRIKLNQGSIQTTLNVYGTGTAVETYIPALLWLGTHASNAVNIVDGDVGLAFFGGEAATATTVKVLGGRCRIGTGATLTTVTYAGGRGEVGSASTTFTVDGADVTIFGTGAITTLNVQHGGTCRPQTTGTITTLNLDETSTTDFSGDARTHTISTFHFHGGATINDPGGTLSVTTWTPDFSV